MNKENQIHKWIDNVLKKIREQPVAWNFNLYEEPCLLSLVGTKSFDKNDEDWATDECFSTRSTNNDLRLASKSWQEILADTIIIIKSYLEKGKYRSVLLNSHGVGCGYVDGDLELIYVNANKKFKIEKKAVSKETIDKLPLHQLEAWITVYTNYRKSEFYDLICQMRLGVKKPSESEEMSMRTYLFDEMSKKGIKL